MVHVRFGGERLVFLGNQDPASYPTGEGVAGYDERHGVRWYQEGA